MSKRSTSTSAFNLASHLRFSQNEETFVIYKQDKYRWVFAVGLGILAITLVTFTCSLLYTAIVDGKSDYFVGAGLFLLFNWGLYVLIRQVFSKEELTIQLQEKTITFRKGRKKIYRYAFDDVAEWHLRGEVPQLVRNASIYTRLYAVFAKEQDGMPSLEIFSFFPAGMIADSPKVRESAYKEGKEVAEMLHKVTKIPWGWGDYVKTR